MSTFSDPEFSELSFYTLSHPDQSYFIHQHIVDAFQAQMADEKTKPIGILFSLIGLFLFLEKGFTGRQVQKAHMLLARHKKPYPEFELPENRGGLTISYVLGFQPGKERDKAISEWCTSVWQAYKCHHNDIARIVNKELCDHFPL